eukprot:828794-Rhodomonas_salina.2
MATISRSMSRKSMGSSKKVVASTASLRSLSRQASKGKVNGTWKNLVDSTPLGKIFGSTKGKAGEDGKSTQRDDLNAPQLYDDFNTASFKKLAMKGNNSDSFGSGGIGSFKQSNSLVVKANIEPDALSDWTRISAQHSSSFHAKEPSTLSRGNSSQKMIRPKINPMINQDSNRFALVAD